MSTQFDRDFAEWMEDPEFAQGYDEARARIDKIDQMIRALDEVRVARSLSKKALAERAGLPAQSVRRFFTLRGVNPTFQTAFAIAGALDVDISIGVGPVVTPTRT